MATLSFDESDNSEIDEFHDSDEDFMYEVEDQRAELDDENGETGMPSALGASSTEIDELVPYSDDPTADQEWTDQYDKEIEEEKKIQQQLQERLSGRVALDSWCKCGNCDVSNLQNVFECYCCHEINGCFESLQSDLVKADLPKDTEVKCVTQHPGFRPVCLEKWSLRLASWKYKTKGKQRYHQIGNEDSFLSSVSYREFCRLLYGIIDNRRIPLPSCAYQAIRKCFPSGEQEGFTGFQLDDEENIEST